MLSIKRAYRKLKERSWSHIYFAVDLHDTIFHANYSGVSLVTFPKSEYMLQYITKHCPEIKIILFSSCYEVDQKRYIDILSSKDIRVDFFNENPDVSNTLTGCFDKKFYYDVLLDDKADFDPERSPADVIFTIKEAKDEYKI